jgi:antirestriction protein ArdC
MSTQTNRASTRRDVYSEITSQLVAAIEANPGKSELPWRKSSGPLFTIRPTRLSFRSRRKSGLTMRSISRSGYSS